MIKNRIILMIRITFLQRSGLRALRSLGVVMQGGDRGPGVTEPRQLGGWERQVDVGGDLGPHQFCGAQ